MQNRSCLFVENLCVQRRIGRLTHLAPAASQHQDDRRFLEPIQYQILIIDFSLPELGSRAAIPGHQRAMNSR